MSALIVVGCGTIIGEDFDGYSSRTGGAGVGGIQNDASGGGTSGSNNVAGTSSGAEGQNPSNGGTGGDPIGGTGGGPAIAGSDGQGGSVGPSGPVVQAGTGCNDHANTASSIAVQTRSGTAPQGTGGDIFNGTYHLTAATDYYGAPGLTWVSRRETLIISEGYIGNFVVELRGKPDLDARVTVWFSPSGISPGVTYKCGPGGPEFTSYTATPTTFTLFADSQVTVYTRQ